MKMILGYEKSVNPIGPSAENPVQSASWASSFKSIHTETVNAGTSTLEIARRAKVSKRDL